MPPKKPKLRDDELFRMQLTNMIDMAHPLVKLAGLIDWSRFDGAYGKFYMQKGRPALPTRLMAGLHLLKHMEGLSDEAVCKRWVENPYFQYFCGEQYFRHRLVLDRSSMTRWRGRIGADELELLIAETLCVAMASGALRPQACERITVDTTVQTKAVAHPTDAHLLLRAMEHVYRLARKHGLQRDCHEFRVWAGIMGKKEIPIDFAHFQVRFSDNPEHVQIAWLFSMVRGYSRLIWARFAYRRRCRRSLRVTRLRLRRLAARRANHFLPLRIRAGETASVALNEIKNMPAFSKMWFNFNAIKVIPNARSM